MKEIYWIESALAQARGKAKRPNFFVCNVGQILESCLPDMQPETWRVTAVSAVFDGWSYMLDFSKFGMI